MLSVGLLGEVEARRDRDALVLPAGKSTELLARLAVDPGVPVRVDVLLEDLWGAPTARNTLQAKVSQLRRALEDRDAVQAVGRSYVLSVEPDRVDLVRALRLADVAATAQQAGDLGAALLAANEGVALFRGDVLPLAGAWAAPYRTRLEETRWTLVETALGARVGLGAGADVVPELEALVAQQPLREELWAALVTALYRAGRQADSLAAIARVRRHLADELGLDPGPRLRALEAEVLQQRGDLDPTPGTRLASSGNVPAPPRPLVGRADDLSAVEEELAPGRVVTLVGPAGVGKTRLATEVASRSRLPGGAWLVRLDTADGSSDLGHAVAETMGLGGGRAGLVDRLRGAATLLVLDNCEHLVEEASALVDGLVSAAPGTSVLATSQLRLGLDHEVVIQLAPLPPAASLELFLHGARRLRRGFEIDARGRAVVAEVCEALDHLPLAIELAAARVRSLPVEEIARRLDDRFALLRDPASHAAPRRRALEAAISWSYELLFPDDQRGLWAAACFAGGATYAALESVMAALGVPATAVPDTLARLADRSLLDFGEGPDAPRYRLLDSVRVFATERLRESGEEDMARAAHLRWYRDRARWCDETVRTGAQAACVAFARSERADVDAAVGWGLLHDPGSAAELGLGMAWTWVVLGDGAAGAARVRAALNGSSSAHDRARGMLVASWLESSAGDLTAAQADLTAATDLSRTTGDPTLEADVHWYTSFLAIQQGNAVTVIDEATASLAVRRDGDDGWSVAAALLLVAYGHLMRGDAASAERDATEAQGLLRPIGDDWGLIHAHGILGGVAQATGRLAAAATAFDEAAESARRLGFLGQSALHRASWARCLARAGDVRARAALDQALEEANAVADGRLATSVRLNLARLLRSTGDGDGTLSLLQENDRWYAASGGGHLALLNRVEVAAARGDEIDLLAALDVAREASDLESVISALDALALMASRVGDDARARALLSEGDSIAASAPYLIDHTERYDAVAARAMLA